MSDHQGPEPALLPPPPGLGGSTVGAGFGDGLRRGGGEAADIRAHARQGGAPLVEACPNAGQLALAGAHELLRRALVGHQGRRPVGELPFGRLDGADDVTVAARDGAHHGELGDEVAEVGGAEHGVDGAQVLMLVHRHGTRRQGGAGEAELLVGEALESAVVLDLPADRLESTRRAGVARDGAADLGVERGDLRGELARLGLVLLQRSRARARRSATDRTSALAVTPSAIRAANARRRIGWQSCSTPPREASGRPLASGPGRAESGRHERAESKPSTRQGAAQVQESQAPSRRCRFSTSQMLSNATSAISDRNYVRLGRSP